MGMNNNISEVNSGWMDESSTKIWMYTFYFLFMFDLPVFLSFLSFSSAILSPLRFLVDLHFWIYELKLRRLKLETTMSLIFFLLFLDIFFLSPSFSLAHSLLSFTANFFFTFLLSIFTRNSRNFLETPTCPWTVDVEVQLWCFLKRGNDDFLSEN